MFDSVGMARLKTDLSQANLLFQLNSPQTPFLAEHSPPAPTTMLVFSHEWTLHSTLDLMHLSCTTQGQIQEENDYAIVKVSTTTTIIATHYEVINPSGHSSTATS